VVNSHPEIIVGRRRRAPPRLAQNLGDTALVTDNIGCGPRSGLHLSLAMIFRVIVC
jgi:hypothetical protein